MRITERILISLFAITLFLSLQAQATITINGVTGASIYIDNSTTTSLPVIAGGLGGTSTANACASKDNVNTCDSCGANPVGPCNNARIYDGLALNITISTDKDAGTIAISQKDTGSSNLTVLSTSTLSSGGSGTISIDWTTICAAVTESTDSFGNCAAYEANTSGSAGQATLYVGVDVDGDGELIDEDEGNLTSIEFKVFSPPTGNTTSSSTFSGISDITTFPGDQKIYIDSVSGDLSSAIISGINVEKLRVMYSSSSALTDINASSSVGQFQDFTISDGSVSDATVTGLTNDVEYILKFASIDTTGNMLFVQDASMYGVTCVVDNTPDDCAYTSIPSEVIGLLVEDLNCFISTAAYGSLMAPEVKTFREFRNNILLKTSWGRKFVKFYYSFGPKAALWISGSEFFKTLVRLVLWPLWLFSFLSLKIGLIGTFTLFFIFTLSVFSLPTIIKLRKTKESL